MIRNVFVAFMFILTGFTFVSADNFRLTDWKARTSLLTGIDCVNGSDNTVWFATEGGVFKYFPGSGDYEVFRNIDALSSLDVSFTAYNGRYDYFFVGQKAGYLDIYDEAANSWINITDINLADNYPDKTITGIVFDADKAYIAGGFGLAVFDIERKLFLENVLRIGNFPSGTKVNDINLDSGVLTLATSSGTARASLSSSLTVPSSWTTISDGLPGIGAEKLLVAGDTIYCSAGKSIYRIDDSVATEIYTDPYHPVRGLFLIDGRIAFSNSGGLFRLDGGRIGPRLSGDVTGAAVIDFAGETDVSVLFEKDAGFVAVLPDDTLRIQPNTPLSNSFTDISSSPDGSVWIACDDKNLGLGQSFLRLKDNQLTVYDNSREDIKSSTFYRINCDELGRVFVSSFGAGFHVGTPSGDSMSFEFYDAKNSPLRGIESKGQDDGFYELPAGIDFDADGTAWIATNGDGTPGPMLLSLDRAGNFRTYTNSDKSAVRHIYSIETDFYGTKWVGGYPGAGSSLQYYNEMSTPDDTGDDVSGALTTSSYPGLLSGEHFALETDYAGMLWIGTLEGLALMVYPDQVLSGGDPVIVEIESLAGQRINDIYIDSRDYKWIATGAAGVWVLSGTGETVIAHVHKENSPLTTDEINSIHIDEQTGIVYIGTNSGLFTAQSLSIKPEETFNIRCYPQPFDLKKHSEAVIDGLSSQADIRIMTVDGETVRTLSSGGRVAVWDGKNESGNFVSAGVYLIVASSGDTNEAGVGKIAVIR